MTPPRELQVTFDAADPGALCRFWCEALGYEIDAPPPGFATWDDALASFGVPPERRNDASAAHHPEGSGPRLFFQKVPEGKAAKNRVHLDVRAAPGLTGDDRMAALEAECVRLVAAGGVRLERHEPAPPMSHGFIVMADPEDIVSIVHVEDALPQAGHIVMLDPEGNEFCLD